MPRFRDHHLHLPSLSWSFVKTDNSQNLKFLYAIRVGRDLVMKLSIFFLPIFLYQQGSEDSFWNFLSGGELQRGVLLLAVFYLIHRITVFISGIQIGKLIAKLGYQHAMMIGFGLFGVFLTLLYVKTNPGWLLLLASIVSGLETNFFWNSYFTLISKYTRQKHMGSNMGIVNFLAQLSQAIAPAIGGLLVVNFGFNSLFMVGLVGAIACLLFVLGLDLKKENDRVSWKEFADWLKEKTFVRLALSQVGRYINDATLIFWPLYVFLLLGTVDRVGYLYTFSLFLALMVSFGVGIYIDHQKNKKPFFISGGVLSVLWILRSQVVSFWQVAIIDAFERLSNNFYAIFHDAIAFKRGKGRQALSYFLYREMLMSLGGIIFWIFVIGVFFIFQDPWLVLFSLPAMGVLLGLLIQEHHRQ